MIKNRAGAWWKKHDIALKICMHACDTNMIEIWWAVFDKYPVSKNIWKKTKKYEFFKFLKGRRKV